MTRTKKEYGGFLPLELNPGKEWFATYEPSLMRFNSVKASLICLLEQFRPKRICLPYYYCPTTIAAIKHTGTEVTWYHIGEDLLGRDIPDEPDTMVLLVNYFGVLDEALTSMAQTFCRARVILDHAHSFFCPPLQKENVYSTYSAKKFFGIPDGAYLVGEVNRAAEQAPSFMAAHAQYLLTAYEEGTNAAYGLKKQVDGAIAGNYAPMSVLAAGLLQNVDYDRVCRRRKENFSLFHRAFADVNALQLPDSCAAYHYPLLLNDMGEYVKKRLVQDKIYVPTLWNGQELHLYGTEFEKGLTRNTAFLPVDQRYDKADVQYMIEKIKEYMNEYS